MIKAYDKKKPAFAKRQNLFDISPLAERETSNITQFVKDSPYHKKNKNHIFCTFLWSKWPKKITFPKYLWQCLPYSFRVPKWPKNCFFSIFVIGGAKIWKSLILLASNRQNQVKLSIPFSQLPLVLESSIFFW